MDETIPPGLCQCGCGQRTALAPRTNTASGQRKGQPNRYVRGHGPKKPGALNGHWKGGLSTRRGYILRYVPDHPHANAVGYVLEHRLVMEQQIGRFLHPSEVVHHKDGCTTNNAPDNLQLLGSVREHNQVHAALRAGRWARKYDACTSCGRSDRPHNAHGLCWTCYKRSAGRAT